MAESNFKDILFYILLFATTGQLIVSSKNVVQNTEERPFIRAFGGLGPIITVVAAQYFVLEKTTWGMENQYLALLITFPVYGLINSRMIICTVSHMRMKAYPLSSLWFLLFAANRYAVHYFRKSSQVKFHSFVYTFLY